jgi:hypothetical protein
VVAPVNAQGSVVDIRVTDCLGNQSPITPADRFTYDSPFAVTGISPSSGVIGEFLTVSGFGFSDGCGSQSPTGSPVVKIDGTPVRAASSFYNASFEAPPHAAGTVAITVTNCNAMTSAVTPATTFTYLGPAVTSLSPIKGAPGTEVTVSGTSFTGGCTSSLPKAEIGGIEVPLSDGVGPSDVALRFVVPQLPLGTYDVQVKNCQGDLSPKVAADKFRVASRLEDRLGIIIGLYRTRLLALLRPNRD